MRPLCLARARLIRCSSWVLSTAAALSAMLGAAPARADFAAPPDSPYRSRDPERWQAPPTGERVGGPWEPPPDPDAPPHSTLRFHVGPALLVQPASPGLFTALDIGQGAVGARVSASWLRAESDQGLAAYTGELWIDLRHRYQLHPIVGAGASLLRGGALGSSTSAGAGVLRGALEYELPIVDADARLSLNALVFVPAIATERTRPWTMLALMVGAGF
jgi:hypothetical protein